MSDQINVTESFEFDLAPKDVEYKLRGKDGVVTTYIVTEASEDAWGRYQDLTSKGTKFGPDGKPEFAGEHFGSATTVLVAGCLFKVTTHRGETKLQPVTLNQVKAIKAQITQHMARKIMEISEIARQKDTIESLDAEIAKLQERRAKLVSDGNVSTAATPKDPANAKNGDGGGLPESISPEDDIPVSEILAKNAPSATTATSVGRIS